MAVYFWQQALLAAGRLTVGGPLWTLALDQILLRCVDTETQVLSAFLSHFNHNYLYASLRKINRLKW